MTVFKYEEICRHYSLAIEKGILKSGDKMDSLRKTAEHFDCSLSVAMQAYGELERRGFIRPVEKSGFFIQNRSGENVPQPQNYSHSLEPRESLPSSMIGTVMAMSRRSDFLPFSATIPDLSLLPVGKLASMIAESAKGDRLYINHYTDRNGEEELRAELARLMLRRGVLVSPGEIVVTNGCTEALHLAVSAVTEPGETVALESPAYLGMITMLRDMKRKVLEIPTRADRGMDLDRLEEALEGQMVRAVVLSPEFQNPLGSVMSDADRQRICSMAEEKGFTIIEDDTYGDSAFVEKSRKSLKSFDRCGTVVYCSSLSKTLSPGLRMGWMLPGKHLDVISERKQVSGLGGTVLLERTMARFLREGYYDLHMKSFRKKIAAQTWEMRGLAEKHFPEGTKISSPSGGYFLWIEMDESVDSLELFRWAFERKIGIIPGPVYSASGKFRNCIRLSCGSPVTKRTARGMESLGRGIREISSSPPRSVQ